VHPEQLLALWGNPGTDLLQRVKGLRGKRAAKKPYCVK